MDEKTERELQAWRTRGAALARELQLRGVRAELQKVAQGIDRLHDAVYQKKRTETVAQPKATKAAPTRAEVEAWIAEQIALHDGQKRAVKNGTFRSGYRPELKITR
jgi:hypothetical protein